MDETERHTREMNLNAHFAWGLAMWGSADVAREEGLFLPASIGYYYSAFHACFAAINTNTAIPFTSLNRTGHTKLQEWIGDFLPGAIPIYFQVLRDLREGMNYLGLGDAASKLSVIRGAPLSAYKDDVDFKASVMRARALSLNVLHRVLEHLATWRPANRVTVPKRNDPEQHWLTEYMQEDFLASVLPEDDVARTKLLKRIVFPLSTSKES